MSASRSDMMPLWTDAYLADTQDLDAIQHGMYFMLIIRAWRSGQARLRDDERALANIARVSLAQWRKHSPAIMHYWTLKNGFWTQKRLSELWSDREAFQNKQSKRAKNSEQSSPKIQKRIPEKDNENNEGRVAIAEAVAVADVIDDSTLSAGVKMLQPMAVRELCLKAAGDCIKATSQSHIRIQDVMNWLQDEKNPCDLQRDVLPALREIAARASPPRNVTTFRYFENPVMEYRDRRLAGNPTPQTPKAQHDRSNSNPSKHEQKTNSIIQSAVRASSRVGRNSGHQIPEEWANPPASSSEGS